MPHTLVSLLFAALALTRTDAAYPGQSPAQPVELRITVVFNNVPHRPGLTADWGFSALIEGAGKPILFDTGGAGAVLLANMRRLGLSARSVEAIVLSHIHADRSRPSPPGFKRWGWRRSLPATAPGMRPSPSSARRGARISWRVAWGR